MTKLMIYIEKIVSFPPFLRIMNKDIEDMQVNASTIISYINTEIRM